MPRSPTSSPCWRGRTPHFVVLPELSFCGYLANQVIWRYADEGERDCRAWTAEMAIKYGTHLGIGYLDRELSLILFPHACPADPKKPELACRTNDFFCGAYANCVGPLEDMPDRMGTMMGPGPTFG